MSRHQVPAEIESALKSDESVDAVFRMGGELEIYATPRRFFGKRGDRLVGIDYAEIQEVQRRSSHRGTWRGIIRLSIGLGFMAAGAITGFENPLSTTISLLLFLIGGAFVLLGLFRRDDWVELRIQRREPPPSFWYIVAFLPFYLILQSRKRYRVPGDRDEVDAFYRFLTARLASSQHTGQ